MGITSILLLLGAVHGMFLASVIITMKGNRKHANKLLAAILFLFSIILIWHVSFHTGEDSYQNDQVVSSLDLALRHLSIVYSLSLLIGPLLYLYFQSLIEDQFSFDRTRWTHFIPSLLVITLSIPVYLGWEVSWPGRLQPFIHWFVYAQFLGYLLLLGAYWIKKHTSGDTTTNKIWTLILYLTSIMIWSMALFMSLTNAPQENWNYVWIVASIFIYACGYLALRRPQLFRKDIRILKKPEEKYEKSAPEPRVAAEYKARLLQCFEKEKPYLQQGLSLPDLASHLKISHHHISQIINKHFHQNFFEFVNSYRVSHARKLILDPACRHLKLSEIGYQSGFNSTSVFNATFKKVLNQTPKEFKKTQLK